MSKGSKFGVVCIAVIALATVVFFVFNPTQNPKPTESQVISNNPKAIEYTGKTPVEIAGEIVFDEIHRWEHLFDVFQSNEGVAKSFGFDGIGELEMPEITAYFHSHVDSTKLDALDRYTDWKYVFSSCEETQKAWAMLSETQQNDVIVHTIKYRRANKLLGRSNAFMSCEDFVAKYGKRPCMRGVFAHFAEILPLVRDAVSFSSADVDGETIIEAKYDMPADAIEQWRKRIEAFVESNKEAITEAVGPEDILKPIRELDTQRFLKTEFGLQPKQFRFGLTENAWKLRGVKLRVDPGNDWGEWGLPHGIESLRDVAGVENKDIVGTANPQEIHEAWINATTKAIDAAGDLFAATPFYVSAFRRNTLGDLRRALENYRAVTGEEPSGFDSLIKADGTLFDALALTPSSFELVPYCLTAAQTKAFINVGIREIQVMNARGVGDPTWSNVAETRTLSADTPQWVARLSLVGQRKLGLDTNAAAFYVVFGLGEACSIVGRGLAEAPISIPDKNTPINVYCRYLVIYALTSDDGVELPKAQPIGVANHDFKSSVRFDK